MIQFPVYLDYNATTPCDPEVVQAMLPFFSTHFGNAASRDHIFGWQAKEAVTYAREQVAQLVGAEPAEIIFTSGATESNNLALKGVFETYASKGKHIITCNIEHKAVLDPCTHLEKLGAAITRLAVKESGLIDLSELENSFRADTILVCIMYANNEIGTILPIQEIGAIAKKKGVLLFSDATQAVGKISVDVNRDGIDLMSFSSHKIYGPKGVGALYVRRKNPRVRLTAQMDGGGHEKGLRSGTLNVPGIVGFGKACEICLSKDQNQKISTLRNKLEASLLNIKGVLLNGTKDHRLPNVSNLCFKIAEDESLVARLNKSIAVSTGSACMSETLEPSYVLKALGLDDRSARHSIRFSLGRYTTEEEIDYVINELSNMIHELRNEPVTEQLKN